VAQPDAAWCRRGAGGEFRVEAPLGQGAWIGVVSEVEGRILPVLMVRTFTD
jgi:hypothetical protein